MYEGTSLVASELSLDIDLHGLLARTAKEEAFEADERIAGSMLAIWAYILRDPLDHRCITVAWDFGLSGAQLNV